MDEWRKDAYTITTDPGRLDRNVVFGFLSTSYWAKGIPFDVFVRSIQHSLNFSLWHVGPGVPQQVGFARVITDRATFGYVGDVFVLEAHRGRGLSQWLMQVILEHPELQGFRRWCLLTRDAHALYARAGFTPLSDPTRWMERWTPDAYGKPPSS